MNVGSLRRNAKLNGRYRIRSKIGEGWEGVTYEVRDRLDGRVKALKLITNVKRRKAILNQARVMVRLQHPNIIDYYNVDTLEIAEDTYYFLLVEFLRGPRLSEIIERNFRRKKTPPLFDTLRLFYQICRGMAYVHDQHILHDDLHTDNIIVTGYPLNPVPKLFDFWGSGMSKARSRRVFDIQCAGQVLFECMTGREAYRIKSLRNTPPEITSIIRRCHGRVQRYGNFHEIVADLESLRDWD